MMSDFSESYANKLLQGILQYSHTHTPWVVCKMPLSVYASGGLGKVLEFALQWKADAIIAQFRDGDDVDMFRRNGILAIAQDYQNRFSDISNITGAYFEQGRICADYLIDIGAVNFAFYGLQGRVWSVERREGFENRIAQRLEGTEVIVNEVPEMNDIWWYDLDSLVSWLRKLPKPVAIMASDDNAAFHLIEACQQHFELGMRVPDDIIILGVDDDEALCQLSSPPLSSLSQRIEHAGYMVAEMIDRRLAMPLEERFNNPENISVMPGNIVVRKSSDVFLHDNPYIKKVCTYIQQNVSEAFSVEDLVDLVPMSRRLLEKLFRAQIGISIYQYVIRTRVDRMKLLMDSGMSAQEAAQNLNLDYKVISRTFKSAVGMTPARYAKTYSKGRKQTT